MVAEHTQLEAIHGREADLTVVRRLIDEPGCTTLLGPGGIGKTLLAQHIHAAVTGAVWVALAPAQDLRSLHSELARALDISIRNCTTASDASRRLTRAMAHRLVILDNAEHLVDEIRTFAAELPENTRLLVTSREVLGLPDERIHLLASLTPEAGQAIFLAHARRIRSVQHDDSVARLVAALDGLPLALILAASRVSILTPAQILERLDERIRLLRRPGSDRHDSMSACLNASLSLLDPSEISVLSQLSIFRGVPRFSDVEAIVSCPEEWLLDVLQSLSAKSLVSIRHATSGEASVHICESLKQLLRARLDPEDPVRARHAAWMEAEVAAHPISLIGTKAALDRLEALCPDLLFIIEHLRSREPSRSASLGLALRSLAVVRWPTSQTALFFEDLAALAMPLDMRAELLFNLVGALQRMGNSEGARSWLERLDTIAEQVGSPRARGLAALRRGMFLVWNGSASSARPFAETAIACFEPGQLHWAHAQKLVGVCRRLTGQSDPLPPLETATDTYRRLGAIHEEALALSQQALTVREPAVAKTLLRTADQLMEEHGTDEYFRLMLRSNEAFVLQQHGTPEEVIACTTEPLLWARRQGHGRLEANLLVFQSTARSLQRPLEQETLSSLQAAIRSCSAAGLTRLQGFAELHLAATLHRRGELSAAGPIYRRAVERYEQSGVGGSGSLARFLAWCCACEDDGAPPADAPTVDLPDADHLIRVWLRLATLRARADARELVVVKRGLEPFRAGPYGLRLALRVLDSALDRIPTNTPRRQLRIRSGGRTALFSDGAEIQLGRRRAPKRIFLYLAARQIAAPGVPVTHRELIAEGWPNERIAHQPALNRLYSAIKTLRQLGCESILETREEGYLFTRGIDIVIDI